MKFLSVFLRTLDKINPPSKVYAHCDVPCGIYDIAPAKIAASTVAKMVEKIEALNFEELDKPTRNSFVRMVMTKEQHAELCKRELLILWTDFFKPEHLAMFPDLHDAFWQATKLCSKNKQGIDPQVAQELQDAVAKIGDMLMEAKAKAQK
ncbi:MAG: superoxide dismutase, Ni [Candidatus Terrybacteria bacterium RIFCSPLOWO2_01_FULL_44_24]|uniref:Superoxide dismutase, Ni n=1 Tax=Candidatus Terrybacteria bacterium RIFCSPHIGHO2_01_FULL_43_35 TaxID=1802361 RepID=A0A1G2PF81_9BACT|nr:MAG: superoxide dismutase, Ni [Candidatus Terrybacteria bacterium RIFCSPHIGHO2_01_FULL_43_35]OHA49750.1 MAG: superoxide dismutase, Ni [Candidatus Terrybacteria bacterium RIFCSPHIGHO2_02_FULL_43_14]OHA51572.1 MAG: superoxide dismutase, Ni [Candidatus Terrybacteria bacterium RIFCSPLOWO2_01_FULL_44_24]